MKIIEIERHDGSVVRLYQSKTDPHCFLPLVDGKVINWTERFSKVGRKK